MDQNDHESKIPHKQGEGECPELEQEAIEQGAPERSEEAESETDRLSSQLADAQAQAAEYLDGWQRARAEFSNYRRREEQRRQQMDGQIRADVLRRLLPVLDDMERAFQAVPGEAQGSQWVEGLAMVGKKLLSTLEKDGLSVMAAQAGDRFDPNFHEAVLCEPSDGFDEGQIIQILQRGYLIGENVLRPAMVRVSSGKITEHTEQ